MLKRLSTLAAGACLMVPLSSAVAQQKKNPGPADFEITFKLPPPKPLSPEEALKTFAVQEGYRVELVAAEPLVEAPIAISFDEQGRLFVVEMRGYMHDIQGSTEKEPNGRIRMLEDTDGDGVMDKATTYVDHLVLPRSVLAVNGGVLVAEPPHLYFCKDTDGDGKADTKEVVADDYGSADGQPEHMANTPYRAMDNWIWSAKYASRFRLQNGAWQKAAGLGRGQYGLCQDDAGRLFFNYNSDFLRGDLLPAEAIARNPRLAADASSVNWRVVKDQTVWPSHPTPGVNRGYGGALRKDGTLASSTATCGALIYRGDALPPDARGNAFIPEPAGNLVKRFRLSEKDGLVRGENVLKGRDFLTSSDERFRPVQAADGPDGALYIVDMYRGIIQHAGFLTHYLIANIEDRKLAMPVHLGRIWRIVPDKAGTAPAFKLPVDTAGRVAALGHANGWVRDTAQRLLVESADRNAVPALTALVQSGEATALARLHALWTLEGLAALNPEVLKAGLKDADLQVRAAAVRLAGYDLMAELAAMTGETEPLVRAHLAIKLTSFPFPDATAALADLIAKGRGNDVLVREAAMSGLLGRETAFVTLLTEKLQAATAAGINPMLEAMSTLIARGNKAQPFEEILTLAAAQEARSPTQMALLKGLASLPPMAKGGKATDVKLIWFEKAPPALAALSGALGKDKKAVKLMDVINSRVAWPDKPGAPPPPKVVPLTPAQLALFEKGKMLYTINCATCHQPHGMGLDGLAPPLVDSPWVNGDPTVPARVILHGLAGPIKVGSRTYDLAMPPLMHLQDEDIAAILTYVRREWEHTASAVEVEDVRRYRQQFAGRSLPWTEEELRPAPVSRRK